MLYCTHARKRASNLGVGLTELLIAMGIVGFLLAGAYRFASRTTLLSTDAAKAGKFTKDVAALQTHLNKTFWMIGYNPALTPYDIHCTAPGTDCVADANKHRIGVTNAAPSKIEFTADLPVDSTTPPDGVISPDEQFALWVADDDPDNISTHISYAAYVNPDAEPCTPLDGVIFTTTHKLYTRVRPATAGNPTVPVMLSNRVLCFEIRYYRDGDPALQAPICKAPPQPVCEPRWVRLCPPSASSCSTNTSTLRVSENLPPGPGWSGTAESGFLVGDSSESKYYQGIRDKLRKIQVGILLMSPTSRPGKLVTETLIMEYHLTNLPWLQAFTKCTAPSGSCDTAVLPSFPPS